MERYEQGWSAAFFAERAVKTAHGSYEILQGSSVFGQAPGGGPQSLDYLEGLLSESFGPFLKLVDSTIPGDHELQAENDRALCSLFINLENEQCERIHREARSARHASTRKLVMKYLESDKSQVCATRTRAA